MTDCPVRKIKFAVPWVYFHLKIRGIVGYFCSFGTSHDGLVDATSGANTQSHPRLLKMLKNIVAPKRHPSLQNLKFPPQASPHYQIGCNWQVLLVDLVDYDPVIIRLYRILLSILFQIGKLVPYCMPQNVQSSWWRSGFLGYCPFGDDLRMIPHVFRCLVIGGPDP